jgi:predicted nucleic acid-binding protein
MTHLDTSFLIGSLTRGSEADHRLREWLKLGEPVRMSAVGWAEFLCGPVDAAHVALVAELLQEPVPLLAEDAATTARLFNVAGRRRGSLVDCMIAAVALRSDAALATANPADFRRFAPAGLRLVER